MFKEHAFPMINRIMTIMPDLNRQEASAIAKKYKVYLRKGFDMKRLLGFLAAILLCVMAVAFGSICIPNKFQTIYSNFTIVVVILVVITYAKRSRRKRLMLFISAYQRKRHNNTQ